MSVQDLDAEFSADLLRSRLLHLENQIREILKASKANALRTEATVTHCIEVIAQTLSVDQ
jgi:hypothetical protein